MGLLSKWKVCRICLTSDGKLYHMKQYNLSHYYKQLIANYESSSETKELPPIICWECATHLISAVNFRYKIFRGQALLKLLQNTVQNGIITNPDIPRTDREKYNLISSLSEKIFEVNHADYHFTYTESIHETEKTDFTEIKTELDDNGATSSDEFLIKTSNAVKKKRVDKISDTKVGVEKVCVNKVGVEKVGVFKVDKRRKPANEVLNEDIFIITDLSYQEQVEEIKKRQDSDNYINSEFKCDRCFKGFLDEEAFKSHVNRHTDQSGAFSCDVCKIRFKKAHALRNHITSHMQKFRCKKCTYVTTRRHAAKLHEEYHNGTRYQCPHCQENFAKISTYMSHIRIKHPSDFVCELCGYSFVSAKGLGLHKKLKHRFDDQQIPPDGPSCDECNVIFINRDALDKHLKLSTKHGIESENKNRSQSKGYSEVNLKNQRNTEVKKKRSNSKPEGPIACEQCEMQLPDSLSYYRHFRRSHPDKNRTNYPSMKSKSMCEVCGKMFQSLALLQDHSFTHTDSKQFACPLCDKRFQRKYRLIAHGRVHSRRQQHACHVCGRVFTTASNLQRHMVSHTGLKPFKCEMCDKCFKHSSEKRVHVTYVHMKKPWPKRARGHKKINKQIVSEPPQTLHPIDTQSIWPPCSNPKPSTILDKPIYYNIKI